MNKKEFVALVAEKADSSQKEAELHVNAMLDAIKETLAKREDISFVGFGNFVTKERAERTMRNPQNPDETITVPATVVPSFKPGKALKEAVNK